MVGLVESTDKMAWSFCEDLVSHPFRFAYTDTIVPKAKRMSGFSYLDLLKLSKYKFHLEWIHLPLFFPCLLIVILYEGNKPGQKFPGVCRLRFCI